MSEELHGQGAFPQSPVSRTERSLTNVRIALALCFLGLILSFFARRVFLAKLGAEVLGLNTTAQNLLGFLNIAELGVGSAVAYCLYRPLFDGDRATVNAVVSVQGWLYRRVAWIVIEGAMVMTCFFPLIFAKSGLPLRYAYASFAVYLFSSLLGYVANYRQIVLTADQKEWKITLAVQGVRLVKIAAQTAAVMLFAHGYVWWLSLEALAAVATSVMLRKSVKKEYPWLEGRARDGKALRMQYPQVMAKTKQIFFHKIGGFVLGQTTPLVIYAFTTLALVAVYGNYLLITQGLSMGVAAMLNGITAGVGNLVAEGNKTAIKKVFWELTLARLWMAAVLCFGLWMLGDGFISLWVGDAYLLPRSALAVLTLNTFINLSRTNDTFLNAYGLFGDVWAPVTEAALNIGLSVLLGHFFGLTGILCGVCASLLVVICCWKPFYLYRHGFSEPFREYVFRILKCAGLLAISFFGAQFLLGGFVGRFASSWAGWFLSALVIVSVFGAVSGGLLCMADSCARSFAKRIGGIVCGRRRR